MRGCCGIYLSPTSLFMLSPFLALSADAWMETNQFRLHQQAGAPPDMFAKMGQNWGFPTYDWEEMAKDGYSWWRRRLRQLSLYFQAYRIDHILGFFRIWEIPRHRVSGLMGECLVLPALFPSSFSYPYLRKKEEEEGEGVDFKLPFS